MNLCTTCPYIKSSILFFTITLAFLGRFFRLTSSVIRKIMHKIGLMGNPDKVAPLGAIYALYLKFSTQRNLVPVAEFHRENVSFTRKTAN